MSTPQAPEDTAPSGGRPGRARIATRLLRGRPERRRRRSGAHDRAEGEPEPPFEAEGRSYPSFAPELASSWLSYRASFVHVAIAALFAREAGGGDYAVGERDREACRERLPGLIDAYERRHGPIVDSYFARNAFAGAALTEDDELDLIWGTHESLRHPDLVALLMRCQELSYAAWHRLSEFDRRFCQDMIFAVAIECLRRMDQAARRHETVPESDPERDSDATELLAKKLDEAEDFMLRCAGRRTQIRYTKGMLLGLLPALALIGVTVAVLAGFGITRSQVVEIAVVMGAGAVGALVSVLSRMTFGRFSMNLPTLDHDMRSTDLRLVGMMRPVVGAVFGFMVYAFIKAALLPVEPQGDGPELFLYVAVGFLAGFSERLAQDMFARSGQGLFGSVGEAPASGPAAGLSPPPGSGGTPKAT